MVTRRNAGHNTTEPVISVFDDAQARPIDYLQESEVDTIRASLAGHAVYLWHCTRDGNYSLYSSSVLDENYLRGVQVSDSNGQVTFTTIFPGCYSGRWPHMHFEIYSSLATATSGNNDVKTSQLALPAAACNQVYGVASGYDAVRSYPADLPVDDTPTPGAEEPRPAALDDAPDELDAVPEGS